MSLRIHRQIGPARKILPEQTIGILIGSGLPGTLRGAELNLPAKRCSPVTATGLKTLEPFRADAHRTRIYSPLTSLGDLFVQRWNARLKFAASLNPSARAISSFARFVL